MSHRTFHQSEPLVPPLPLQQLSSTGGRSQGGKQKLKVSQGELRAGYGDSLVVKTGAKAHNSKKQIRSKSEVVVSDAMRLGALPPVAQSSPRSKGGVDSVKVAAARSWAGQLPVAVSTALVLSESGKGELTTSISGEEGNNNSSRHQGAVMVPNPPSFPKGGPLGAVTAGSQGGSVVGGVAKTARPTSNNNLLTAPNTDFNNTLSSTTSIDTLQGRIKALEGAVARTPRLDPIASWPVKPSASLAAATNKKGGLQSAARPPLAVEVEGFIRKEMLELTSAVKNPTHLQMIPIFREAFSCLINHFTEYHSIFSLIKTEYDSVISDLSHSHHHLTRLQTEMRSLKEVYTVQLQEEREKLGTTISDLQAQLAAALKANHNQRVLQIKLEKDIVNLNETLSERDADIDDAQDRIRLLTSTTRELGAKNSNLHTKLSKSQTQNEHLMAMVQALQDKIKQELQGGSINVIGDHNGVTHAEGRIDHLAATGREKLDLTKVVKEAVLTNNAPLGNSGPRGGRDSVSHSNNAAAAAAALMDDSLYGRQDVHDRNLKLEGKITDLRRTIVDLRTQVTNLMKRIKQMQEAREDDTLTPRPKWIKTTQSLPEFHLNHLQTSEEILEELVTFTKEKLREDGRKNERDAYSKAIRQWLDDEDLCESDLVVKNKYFIGKGSGPHIPPCLRWSGRVRNKKMKKGDVETLLGKFWNERRALYKTESIVNVKRMQEHFNDWLVQQTGSVKKAIELAYNIFNVCEMHLSDPDCSMFLKIFRGEISEAAIFDQFETVNKLREIVEKHDKTRMGAVSRFTMQRIMNAFFKAKSTEDMLRLRFALVISCKGSAMVDYPGLFAEDEDGNQSRFVELLRRQHVQEISSFVVEVEEELRKVATDALADLDSSGVSPTSPGGNNNKGGFGSPGGAGGAASPNKGGSHPTSPVTSALNSPQANDLNPNSGGAGMGNSPPNPAANEKRMTITMASARTAVKGLDHKMPDERINEVLAYACGLTPLEFASVGNFYSTEAEPFLARIRCGLLLKRHSPKADEDDEGGADFDDDRHSDSDDEGRGGGHRQSGGGGGGSLLEDGFFTEAELKQVADLMGNGEDNSSDDDANAEADDTQLPDMQADKARKSTVTLSTPAGDSLKNPRTQSIVEFNMSTASTATLNNPNPKKSGSFAAGSNTFGVTALQGTKEERDREAKNRRAVNMEREISDALQQQERERQDELQKRSMELDTFALFAAHPSAAASVNLSSLEQKRKEVALEKSRVEMEQSKIKEGEEKIEQEGETEVNEDEVQPVQEKDVEHGVTFEAKTKPADDLVAAGDEAVPGGSESAILPQPPVKE